MTAHALKGDRDLCLETGMDAYLAKPVDARALCALVEEFGTGKAPATPAAALTGAAVVGH
jgi:CheY-like chemotaxis protein